MRRIECVVCAALLAGPLPLTACSSAGSARSGGGAGGACTATGIACVQPSECVAGVNCGGNCCVGACVGGGDSGVCTAPNVDFSATCAPSCSGGDPQGTWHLVGGCGNPGACSRADAGTGVVGPEGTLIIGAEGSTSFMQLDENLYGGCGEFTMGAFGEVIGSWSEDAGTIGGDSYCVQGSTLYVFLPIDPQSTSDPYLTALRFDR